MGTDSCPLLHVGYVLSGRLHVQMNDGSTLDLEAGELCVIPPGHDAWVVGDEPCRLLDWGGKVSEHASPVDQTVGRDPMSQTPPILTFRVSIRSGASPEAVYDVLSDLRTHLDWAGSAHPTRPSGY